MRKLMPFSLSRLRTAAVVLLALGFAACDDDDDGTNPPATPPAPTGLAADRSDDGLSIAVTWTAVTGATGYVLERAEGGPSGTFEEIAGDLTEPEFTDTDVTLEQAYSYRVAAFNDEGTGSFSSVVTVPAGTGGELVDTLTGDITSDVTLTADTRWILSGFVKVQDGATLTVEPGTTIVGDTAVAGSSLWILRGAQIIADGTAEAPIVFTSGQPEGSRAPGDWGGLLIIGNGIINRSAATTEGPGGEAEDYTGGTDNADTSGTLRYVRIEFAGFDVSQGAGQELNSLSMYAVGSGTTLEFVQSLAGLDDGFEWFGGAVDGRFLVSYESGDDHFDWAEGYRGRNQFVIGFQSTRLDPAPGAGVASSDPQGFEADGCGASSGCDAGFASEPFSIPVFANFTLIGPGTATTPTESGDVGIVLRRGTGGYLTNGIVARWQSQGLSVRDDETNTLMTSDSLEVVNVLLAENASNYDADDSGDFGVIGAFTASNHVEDAGTAAELFTSLDAASLDWTPPAESPAASGAGTVAIPAEFTGTFFGGTLENTTYFGAADPAGDKWWEGWTNYATD
jgi:hypothetical protein